MAEGRRWGITGETTRTQHNIYTVVIIKCLQKTTKKRWIEMSTEIQTTWSREIAPNRASDSDASREFMQRKNRVSFYGWGIICPDMAELRPSVGINRSAQSCLSLSLNLPNLIERNIRFFINLYIYLCYSRMCMWAQPSDQLTDLCLLCCI